MVQAILSFQADRQAKWDLTEIWWLCGCCYSLHSCYPDPLGPLRVFSLQPAMQPYMVLAERIGKMQAQISSSKVRGVVF